MDRAKPPLIEKVSALLKGLSNNKYPGAGIKKSDHPTTISERIALCEVVITLLMKFLAR